MTDRPKADDQGRAKAMFDEQQRLAQQEKALLLKKRRGPATTQTPATSEA